MDNEDDFDYHICLNCQMTVIGLYNYVQHKKQDCPARKTTEAPASNTPVSQAGLNVNVDDILSCLSPSATPSLNQSLSPSTHITPYLSSLNSSPALRGSSQLSLSPTGGRTSEQFALASSASQSEIRTTSSLPILSGLKEHGLFSSPPGGAKDDQNLRGQSMTSPSRDDTNEIFLVSQNFSESTRQNQANDKLCDQLLTSSRAFKNHQEPVSQKTRLDYEAGGFFSVLELQSKESGSMWDLPKTNLTESAAQSTSNSSKITNIIAEIQHESDDSDNEIGSLADDQPPHSHTGGKWKPGQRRASNRKQKHPARTSKHETAYDEVGFNEAGDGAVETDDMYCQPCGKSFTSFPGYKNHFRSNYHLKRTAAQEEGSSGNFFSVLQLQSKGTSDPNTSKVCETASHVKSSQRLKGLKIADILNKIQEESDSDESMDVEVHSKGRRPPQGHTGGKWTPGQRPPPEHTGGKWTPGSCNQSTPSTSTQDSCLNGNTKNTRKGRRLTKKTGGVTMKLKGKQQPLKSTSKSGNQLLKRRSGNSEIDSIGEVETAPDVSNEIEISDENGVNKEEAANSYHCKSCNKTLTTACGYKKHFESSYHISRLRDDEHVQLSANKKSVKVASSQEKPTSMEFPCIPCGKAFSQEWSLVGHMNTRCHEKHAAGHPEHDFLMKKYAEKMKLFSPFQCRLCSFFTKDHKDLVCHLSTPDHEEISKDLIAPIICVICDFRTDDNQILLHHFNSDVHIQLVTNGSKRKCVVKENRYEITCKVCGLFVHSKVHLKRHILAKHSKNDNKKRNSKLKYRPKCPHCNQICASAYNMAIHVRRKHTKERPFKCIFCKLAFCDNGTLKLHCKSKRHLEVVNGIRDLKGRMIAYKGKIVHKDSRKLVKCDYCDFTADSYPSLRPHYIEAHANRHQAGSQLCDATTKRKFKLQKSKPGEYMCTLCNVSLDNKFKLYIHELSHSKKSNLFENELAHKDSPTRMKYQAFLDSLRSDIKSKCPECDQMLSKGQMLLHLRQHTGELPFRCPHCDRGYTSSGSLRRHIFSHLPKGDRKCKVCGKAFANPGALSEHTKRIHNTSGTALHICETCGKICMTQQELSGHVYRNHRERQFKCTFQSCRREFGDKTSFTIHVRTHTGEKPYLCDECGYASVCQQKLTRHKRSHTGERRYSCDYCPYKAKDQNHIRRHMRIHVGSKPYKCPYCDFACNIHENMRKHILYTKKHKGLKVYVCQFCQFGSNMAKEFKEHIVESHGDQVTENDVSSVSMFSGLYYPNSDPRDPVEGQHIHQVKERKPKTIKTDKIREESPPHGYDLSTLHMIASLPIMQSK